MGIFVQAVNAGKPRTIQAGQVALIYAAILIVMAVMQLFSFDKFLVLVESFWLPGGKHFAYVLAGCIVTFEVFAIPFLLQMRLSQAMRIVSMILSWLVPAVWLYIGLWLNLTVQAVDNAGILGASVTLVPGWWVVFVSLALGVLAAWSAWGLWPSSVAARVKRRAP